MKNRFIAVAAILMMLARAQVLAAQQAPIDTITARMLLREAVASLAFAPELHRTDFVTHLAGLLRQWGMSDAVVAQWMFPSATIDSLVKANRLDEARRALGPARITDEQDFNNAAHTITAALIAQGRISEGLALADSLGTVRDVVVELLRDSMASVREANTHAVRSFLERPLVTEQSRSQIRVLISRAIARDDPMRAWAETDTVSSPHTRAWMRLEILRTAADAGSPASQWLLVPAYHDMRKLQDRRFREAMLGELRKLCTKLSYSPCERMDLPLHPPETAMQWVWIAQSALPEGRFTRADSVIDSLRVLLGREAAAMVEMSAALGALTHCPQMIPGCGAYLDRLIQARLAEADTLIARAPPGVADSLRMYAAALLAGRDNERALAYFDAIRDTVIKDIAVPVVSGRMFMFDRELGSRIFLSARNPTDQQVLHLAREQRMRGDTATARRTLSRASSQYVRMSADFLWAQVIRNSGQWQRASEIAMQALELWDPSEEPAPGWQGRFFIYEELGLYRQLLDWIVRQPEPADRVIAIIAVLGSPPY